MAETDQGEMENEAVIVLTVPMIVPCHGSCGVVLPVNLLQTPYLCKFETSMFTYSQLNRIREIFHKS